MNSRIFVDSSLLVEYLKGSKTELLDEISRSLKFQMLVSQTVVSEFLFYHLAEMGGKSPRTLKESASIPAVLKMITPLPALQQFSWLIDHPAMLQLAVNFMENFNLLPNDALILASCKHHNIKILASFDPDFEKPCQAEGILLLKNLADFNALPH